MISHLLFSLPRVISSCAEYSLISLLIWLYSQKYIWLHSWLTFLSPISSSRGLNSHSPFLILGLLFFPLSAPCHLLVGRSLWLWAFSAVANLHGWGLLATIIIVIAIITTTVIFGVTIIISGQTTWMGLLITQIIIAICIVLLPHQRLHHDHHHRSSAWPS